MKIKERIVELKRERQVVTNRIYWMMVEVAVIFGLSAFGAYGLGVYLSFSRKGMFIVLGISFVVSWLLVILRYRMVTKELRIIEVHLKDAQREHITQASNDKNLT
ncbi:MAG: hypothetical protein Q8Q18_00195 [bacterium]|nr:hypothetical protein [bacterium]